MTRTKLFFAFLLVFVPVAVLPSAPAPRGKIRLAPAGKVKVANLIVNNAAVIDENRVVTVGRRGDPAEKLGPDTPGPNEGMPNGAIIDLAKKDWTNFTNGHTTQIWGVACCGGRLLTSSAVTKTYLRSWDLKTHESKEVVRFNNPVGDCRLRCFHKGDRVVVNALEQLLVFDKQERTELACPAGVRWVSGPLAVSPDDAWIACQGDRGQVVCFNVATKKATVVTVAPKGEGEKWLVYGLAFGPAGKLFVCRHAFGGEASQGKAEKGVPAERRAIVRIDLPEGRAVPLDMGRTDDTWGCAVDAKGTWLATWATSRQPEAEELRVYNLASGKLAYREPLKENRLWWVSFTPGGKRLVCVTRDGTVSWWDVSGR